VRLKFRNYFLIITKDFACNGTVVEHPEYGEVIQLQGDQRNNVCQFLTKIGIVKDDQLKIHGF
jgi:translation initiation factor 1